MEFGGLLYGQREVRLGGAERPIFHEFVLANGVEVVGVEGGVALAELFEQGSDIWGGSGGGSGRDPGEQER
jgi:hypothetical protein